MANIKEIVEKEHQRSDIASARVVHLYLEGSFLRAYDWSAWLCVRFVHGFKASNRMYKGIEESVALIGFPPTSLSKFTPDGAETQNVSENEIDLILPSTSIPDEYDTALMQLEYSDWKSSLPVQSTDRQKNKEPLTKPTLSSQSGILGVMQQILGFNVNRKSPFECMEFISKIQEELLAFL